MKMVPRLTLDDARVMMGAAEAKAREIGVDMDIAITDDGGALLMFHRMDNARITSIDIAISKAFTAAAARKSTRAYGQTSQPGGPSYGIHVSNLSVQMHNHNGENNHANSHTKIINSTMHHHESRQTGTSRKRKNK
jgi:uncharacterized protein GlcG (DUF336 family)